MRAKAAMAINSGKLMSSSPHAMTTSKKRCAADAAGMPAGHQVEGECNDSPPKSCCLRTRAEL
jgi:hypothetical protein